MKKLILGNREWCSSENLQLPYICAKIDADSPYSSLYVFNISPFTEQGEKFVHFDIHPLPDNRQITKRCCAKVVETKGTPFEADTTKGTYIETVLEIADQKWTIILKLINHPVVGPRLVLGKHDLKTRVLIDPDQEFCLGHISEQTARDAYHPPVSTKRHLKIAILANNPKLYSNQRLMEAGRERGHDMRFLDIRQTYMNVCSDKPQIYYRGGESLMDIDAVIPRIDPVITFYGCAVTRQFQTIGAFCLNDSLSISKSRDKLYSLQLLSSQGIPMPSTGFANSADDTSEIIKMVGGAPLVIKLLEGTQGKGVVLAETHNAAESVINAFKSLHANILVQEFVKEADGKDIRCFVINGKVVGTMQRQAADGEFRANLHLGGKASAIKVTAEERKIAINAAKAMGLHVAGVDLIRTKHGPQILEINSAPGLEGIERITQKDIAGLMIEQIEKQLKFDLQD